MSMQLTTMLDGRPNQLGTVFQIIDAYTVMPSHIVWRTVTANFKHKLK